MLNAVRLSDAHHSVLSRVYSVPAPIRLARPRLHLWPRTPGYLSPGQGSRERCYYNLGSSGKAKGNYITLYQNVNDNCAVKVPCGRINIYAGVRVPLQFGSGQFLTSSE